MALAVDLKVLGIPELERELKRLEAKAQKSIVRKALRNSAKRVKGYVISNLSGVKVNVQTGQLRDAFENAPIRAASNRRNIRLGIAYPTRDELGIEPGDKHFWPAAVEYGHGDVPAHPYLRPAVDEHRTVEINLIGREIGRSLEREAGK